MLSSKTLTTMQSWSGVARSTLFGTLACMAVSVTFNVLFFDDLGAHALQRSIISATVLPLVLGLPLFCYVSLRLRGLAITNRRLGMVARTDSLTDCLNRGAFTTKVAAQLAKEKRPAGALLVIDADNFKAINDLFGHDAGDEALTIIARSIRAVLRNNDLVGRMGGEEFGVYLPGTDIRDAQIIAERIRRSVNLAIFQPHGRQRALSVSVGGAAYDRATSFSDLFHIADQRLYNAKQTGRNRVIIAHASDHPVIDLKKIA